MEKVPLMNKIKKRKEFAPLGGKFFPLRVTIKRTIKEQNKNDFFTCQRVWKIGKIWKSQEILRWMISGNPG